MAYSIAGTVVFWIAIALLLIALLADPVGQRFRRRRRCPKCWYDLSHTPGRTCSECGYTAGCERKLYKGRRRWRYAWLAMFLSIGAHALRVTPAVKERGWPAAVPTTAIIVSLPWLRPDIAEIPAGTNDISQSLDKRWRQRRLPPSGVRQLTSSSLRTEAFLDLLYRADTNQIAAWQAWICAQVCNIQSAKGDAKQYRWPDLCSRIIGTMRWSGGETLTWIGERQEKTCNELRIETRERWPVGVPIFARMDLECSAYPGKLASATAATDSMDDFKVYGTHSVIACHFGPPQPILWKSNQVCLGKLNTPLKYITYDVVYEAHCIGRPILVRRWIPLESRRETMPFDVDGTVADILEPIIDSEFDDALRSELRPAITDRYTAGPVDFRVCFGNMSSSIAETWPAESVIAVTAEVVHGERVLATSEFWLGRDAWWERLSQFRFPFTLTPAAEQHELQTLKNELQIRLTGNAFLALRDFDATHYWAGDVILPFRITHDGFGSITPPPSTSAASPPPL